MSDYRVSTIEYRSTEYQDAEYHPVEYLHTEYQLAENQPMKYQLEEYWPLSIIMWSINPQSEFGFQLPKHIQKIVELK